MTTGTHHGGPGTRACSRSVLQEQPLGAASAPLAPLTSPQLPRERGVPPAVSPAPAWPQPLSPRGTHAGKPRGVETCPAGRKQPRAEDLFLLL